MKCRSCGTPLTQSFIDLATSPPSNSFLKKQELAAGEIYYPLHVYYCTNCLLVQLDEFKKATDIFAEDYVYFSSYSTSWLAHCKNYATYIIEKLQLNSHSQVIEIASNDGYLLQYFAEKNIKTLGIEPSSNTAAVAQQKGIETITQYFGKELALQLKSKGIQADLLIGNNVLAHVPQLNDFVAGLQVLLSEKGVITMEFPHLLQLINQNQFDTIYHEHFSYLSLYSTIQLFERHQLTIFDVEELPTHGGSLRIYAAHSTEKVKANERIKTILEKEQKANLHKSKGYEGFAEKVKEVKIAFVQFLLDAQKSHKKVVGYGAAAKGNTLLNYCGIKNDLISFISDASIHKQGRFAPGSRIPILSEQAIKDTKPDYVVIFPWNIKEEITQQLGYIRDWNGQFVTAIPTLQIF
jgi:2-polyprenyl-3-methyl-5-hydroxy-6-metoxy-1,4-benzoquinol methylase